MTFYLINFILNMFTKSAALVALFATGAEASYPSVPTQGSIQNELKKAITSLYNNGRQAIIQDFTQVLVGDEAPLEIDLDALTEDNQGF